MASDTMRAP